MCRCLPQYFRTWLYLEIGSLQLDLVNKRSHWCRVTLGIDTRMENARLLEGRDGLVLPQTKNARDASKLPRAGRETGNRSSLVVSEGSSPTDTSILDLQSPEWQTVQVCCWGHPACSPVLEQPQWARTASSSVVNSCFLGKLKKEILESLPLSQNFFLGLQHALVFFFHSQLVECSFSSWPLHGVVPQHSVSTRCSVIAVSALSLNTGYLPNAYLNADLTAAADMYTWWPTWSFHLGVMRHLELNSSDPGLRICRPVSRHRLPPAEGWIALANRLESQPWQFLQSLPINWKILFL